MFASPRGLAEMRMPSSLRPAWRSSSVSSASGEPAKRAYVSTLPRLKLLERTPSRLTRHAREGGHPVRWCRKLLRAEATGSRSSRAMTRSWRPREGWFSRQCLAVAFRR